MSQITAIPGGWSVWRHLTPQDQQEFGKVQAQLLGVKYTPVLVATKVVAGMEYCFLCTTAVVIPNPPVGAAKVYALQPPGAVQPHVVGIVQITP